MRKPFIVHDVLVLSHVGCTSEVIHVFVTPMASSTFSSRFDGVSESIVFSEEDRVCYSQREDFVYAVVVSVGIILVLACVPYVTGQEEVGWITSNPLIFEVSFSSC